MIRNFINANNFMNHSFYLCNWIKQLWKNYYKQNNKKQIQIIICRNIKFLKTLKQLTQISALPYQFNWDKGWQANSVALVHKELKAVNAGLDGIDNKLDNLETSITSIDN